MNKNIFLLCVSVTLIFGCSQKNHSYKYEKTNQKRPNILLIYVDDLGYGDVSSYNPNSQIRTPHIDQLAKEGILFTDAHAPAAICGPSRYGLLTGRYSWRKPDGTGNGFVFSNMRIKEDRMTLASMLKSQGYNTAQIGKWGLRNNYEDALKDTYKISENLTTESFDFPNKRLLGANLCGFDYSWSLIHLSKDKNAKFPFENGLPIDSELNDYDAHRWLPDGTQKALDYINAYDRNQNNPFNTDSEKPFFLYWDPPVPHEPIVPTKQFLGKSMAGDYGDFVVQLDDAIGQLLEALDKNGLAENTIVLFSSDNGPETTAYPRIQNYQHYSMGEWRGVKRDLYEAGTRVPFIVRWPGQIEKGKVTDEPICLVDIMATFATLFKQKLPVNAGEDSYNILPVLLGESYEKPIRGPIVYHTIDRRFAIQKANMLFIDASSGSLSIEPKWFREERNVLLDSLEVELYDLSKDPQQIENIADKYPEIVNDMQTLLRHQQSEEFNLRTGIIKSNY